MISKKIMVVAIAAAVAGCGSLVKVNQDYDSSAELARYKTYGWQSQEHIDSGIAFVDNWLFDETVKGSADAQLASKGYRKLAQGEPDFWIVYHVIVKTTGVITNTYDPLVTSQAAPVWGRARVSVNRDWWYANNPRLTRHTTVFEEGTILVDFVDAKNRMLVWRGSGRASVLDSAISPKIKKKRVEKAVSRIVSQFPPNI